MVRTRVEVQEQTQVGDALVRGLMRAQLGLALRLAAVVVGLIGAIPLLNALFPELGSITVFGVRLNWLVLAALVYPLMYGIGWFYVRAGRTGRAGLRRRRRLRAVTGSALTAAALLTPRRWPPWRSAPTVSASRAPPPTSWSRPAPSGRRWNAAAISGEYLSAASFLGVAGLIAKYGADALWYPVGFTAGYLGLLLFVAAPLRRSGAYTVPDFAEFRLGSPRLRKMAMLVVVVICVFYLVPQYQGAGLALKTLLGIPVWLGPLAVGAIVITNVVAGGMRSITFVQAFQYWLKLTAVAIPALALAGLFLTDRGGELGGPLPPTVQQDTTVEIETDVVVQVAEPGGISVTGTFDGRPVQDVTIGPAGEHTLGAGSTLSLSAGAATPVVAGTPSAGTDWIASGGGLGGHHPLYQVLSIMVATFLGTMGLPHVLVRFYTNPDGRAARRTALTVIALLSLFYLFPTLLGVFSRLYVPQLLITGTADAAVLLAPESAIAGAAGQLLARAGGRRCDRGVPGDVVGSAGQFRRRAGHRRAAGPGPRFPGRGGGRRSDPDPVGAGRFRRTGTVPQCRAGLRRRGVDAVSAAGARHLVARADRGRGDVGAGRRRPVVRRRGHRRGGRRGGRGRAGRLAGSAGRLSAPTI